MILEAISRPSVREPVLMALARHHNGHSERSQGEDRLVLSGLTWEGYLEVDEALGHDRPDPRLYFLDGELEMMSTSLKHEELKKWLGTLMEDYFFETEVETFPHGQATMRILKKAGAEPDESWCFGQQKKFPDVVLEIALTSGGLNKLDIYQRFAVPEVWFWRKDALEIWTLRADGSGYEGPVTSSRLLPGLDIAALSRCLTLATWREARRAFRKTLKKQH
jgi:Uma2 family endonuclease